MKNLRFALVVLILILQSSFIWSQTEEDELKNNQWYVHKVIINEEEYLAPMNEERLNIIGYDFKYFNQENYFGGSFCLTYILQEINFTEVNHFNALYWTTVTLPNCQNQTNLEFNYKYLSLFILESGNLFFHYEISEVDQNTKELIITNNNGDRGYFYTSYLSNPIFELEGVNIYPNPASDILQITLPDTAKERYDFKIYDINGKLIKVFKDKTGKQITLDIQDLNLGVYWLEINTHDSNQRGLVIKISKK